MISMTFARMERDERGSIWTEYEFGILTIGLLVFASAAFGVFVGLLA